MYKFAIETISEIIIIIKYLKLVSKIKKDFTNIY